MSTVPAEERDAAFSLYESSRFAEAESAYGKLLLDHENDALLHNDLGLVLAAQGGMRAQEAIDEFTKADRLWAKESSRDRKYALTNLAEQLRQLERYAEAEANCRAAIAVDPEHGYAHRILGLALRDQAGDKYAAAIEEFSKAASISQGKGSNEHLAAELDWAETLRRMGRVKEAEEKCRKVIEADAEQANAFNLLGLALENQGKHKFTDAILAFKQADLLWTKQSSANRKHSMTNWANVLRKQGQSTEAEAKCLEVLTLFPEHGDAHNMLGLAFQDRGSEHYAKAIEAFAKADAVWAKEGSKYRSIALTNWADTLRLDDHYAEAESKCREAIRLDEGSADAHNVLGLVLHAQGQSALPSALEAISKADELWAKQGSKSRTYALRNWAWILSGQEEHEAAIAKLRAAIEIDSDDSEGHYSLGNALADASQYRDALESFDRAIHLDADAPYPQHNKAHFLFHLGRYDDGWRAWDSARATYARSIAAGVNRSIDMDRARYLANVLGGIYNEREEAERLYLSVLEKAPGNPEALSSLATLYHQWMNSEKPSSSAQSRLSATMRKAAGALRARFGKDDSWKSAIELADFYLEIEDFSSAEEWLLRAKAACGEFRVRRGNVASRFGILHAKRERYELAVEHFREALRIFPENLKLRANLAEAHLKLKQLDRAESEYRRVSAMAPGNIEALIGSAQLCIELAESGDLDRCSQAEKYLSAAIEHGALATKGSKRLTGKELGQVYYLRGYVRAKKYEANSGGPFLLREAESDFRECTELDRSNFKADAALQKLRNRMKGMRREGLFEWLGPMVVCLFSTCVFVLAQVDFFFAGQELLGIKFSATRKLDNAGYYAVLTFGSLLFMVAGLYLPKVLKLKVGTIELEKSTVEQISTPVSLGISR